MNPLSLDPRVKVLDEIVACIFQGVDADDELIAQRARVPVETVAALNRDKDVPEELQRRIAVALAEGTHLHFKAYKALDLALEKILRALADPETDAVLSVELSKVPQRIIDARDRRIAAHKEDAGKRRILNVVINVPLPGDAPITIDAAPSVAEGKAEDQSDEAGRDADEQAFDLTRLLPVPLIDPENED